MKVIREELAAAPEFLRLFDREARSARRVARFCTAEVLDVGAHGGQPFLVTEYVDGPTLWDEVARNGPLEIARLERLAVATALTAIHGAGMVHRDLKPSNVLLSSEGPLVIDAVTLKWRPSPDRRAYRRDRHAPTSPSITPRGLPARTAARSGHPRMPRADVSRPASANRHGGPRRRVAVHRPCVVAVLDTASHAADVRHAQRGGRAPLDSTATSPAAGDAQRA